MVYRTIAALCLAHTALPERRTGSPRHAAEEGKLP